MFFYDLFAIGSIIGCVETSVIGSVKLATKSVFNLDFFKLCLRMCNWFVKVLPPSKKPNSIKILFKNDHWSFIALELSSQNERFSVPTGFCLPNVVRHSLFMQQFLVAAGHLSPRED